MRKSPLCLSVAMLTILAGCVTINVYFPKAEAEKAASQFIGSVIDQDAPSTPQDRKKPAAAKDTQGATDDRATHGEPLASRVLDFVVPPAAAQTPNLRIHTPAVDVIHARMRTRFHDTLRPLLDAGVVGFTHDGLLALRDASSVPLAQRTQVNGVVAADNRDRTALYREIANANGHPEWETRIRDIFAALWIQKAHAGWYYQDANGAWKRK